MYNFLYRKKKQRENVLPNINSCVLWMVYDEMNDFHKYGKLTEGK